MPLLKFHQGGRAVWLNSEKIVAVVGDAAETAIFMGPGDDDHFVVDGQVDEVVDHIQRSRGALL